MALHLGGIDFTTDVYTKPEVDRLVAGAVDGRLEKQDPEGSGSIEWSVDSASERLLSVSGPFRSSGYVLIGEPGYSEHVFLYPSGVLFHRPSEGLSAAYCLPNSAARQAGALPLATEQYVDERTSSVYRFKGSVPTFNDLPRTGNEPGDVWDTLDTGDNYAYVGETSNDEPIWDQLGPSMAGYQKKLTPGHGISIDANANISIPDGGVTNSMLATNSVNGAKIANLSVSTGKLTNGAVSTAKIADGAVTAAKIDPNALSGYALKSDLPTKVSDLENDAGYITSEAEFNAWKSGASVAAGNGSSAASSTTSVAIGNNAKAGQKAIAISSSDNTNTTNASGTQSIAIGFYAKATANEAIAMGKQAQASAAGAVQIGYSANANAVANSLRFRDTVVVNGNGKIPSASLDKEIPSVTEPSTSYDAAGKAADAKATGEALAFRTVMVPLGDGVWQFIDGNTGILVIDGEVTTLPASKTSFETEEYFENANLTLVYAPSVETVGNDAFSYCDALASVSLPAATNIRNRAFSYCGTLASVLLPAATSIGGSAFYGCDALASVSLPAATSIGGYAFAGCGALASVSLPVATSIGGSAFAGCGALASIDLSSFTVAQVQANAAGWGISPPSGKTVTITCSDGTVTIQE